MNIPTRLSLALIRSYQFVFSSFMGGRCRYYPTCSSYAAGAVGRFGALQGLWLAAARILRCHPYCRGGHDPVPDAFSFINKPACRSAAHERSVP